MGRVLTLAVGGGDQRWAVVVVGARHHRDVAAVSCTVGSIQQARARGGMGGVLTLGVGSDDGQSSSAAVAIDSGGW